MLATAAVSSTWLSTVLQSINIRTKLPLQSINIRTKMSEQAVLIPISDERWVGSCQHLTSTAALSGTSLSPGSKKRFSFLIQTCAKTVYRRVDTPIHTSNAHIRHPHCPTPCHSPPRLITHRHGPKISQPFRSKFLQYCCRRPISCKPQRTFVVGQWHDMANPPTSQQDRPLDMAAEACHLGHRSKTGRSTAKP